MPTHDLSTTYTFDATTGTSTAHTVTAAGGNRLIIFRIAMRNGGDSVASASWNGVALALVTGGAIANGTNCRTEIWRLLAPDTGNRTASVTLSAIGKAVVTVSSYTDVQQTSTFGTVATATGSSVDPAVTVTSATGEEIVDSLAVRAEPTTATVNDPQVERGNGVIGTAGAAVVGGASDAPGEASLATDWDLSTSRAWATLGVGIRHAAFAAGFPPELLRRRSFPVAEDVLAREARRLFPALFAAAAAAPFPTELLARRLAAQVQDDAALAFPRRLSVLFLAPAPAAFPPELLRRLRPIPAEDVETREARRLGATFFESAIPPFPSALFKRAGFLPSEEAAVEAARRLLVHLFLPVAAPFPAELLGRRPGPIAPEEAPALVPARSFLVLFPFAAPAAFPFELIRRFPSTSPVEVPVFVPSRLPVAVFGFLAPAVFPPELFLRRRPQGGEEVPAPEARRLFEALFGVPAVAGFPPELLRRGRIVPVEDVAVALAARPDLALLAFLSPAAFPAQLFRRPGPTPSEDAHVFTPRKHPFVLLPFVAPVPFPFELLRRAPVRAFEDPEGRPPFRSYAFLFPAAVVGPTFPAALRFRSFEIDLLRRDVLATLTDSLTVRRTAQSITTGVKGFLKAVVGTFQGLVMEEGGLLLSSEMGRVAGAQVEILVEEASGLVENDEVSSADTGENYTVTAAFVMRAPDGSALFRRALAVVKRA